MKKMIDFRSLISDINEFVKEREWEEHHTARNLATSVSIESAELLEHFQWEDLTYDDIKKDQRKINDISDEIADIFIYLLRMVHKLDLDFEDIIRRKVQKNQKKYPMEKINK